MGGRGEDQEVQYWTINKHREVQAKNIAAKM